MPSGWTRQAVPPIPLTGDLERCELRGEVTQLRRLVRDAQAGELFGVLRDVRDDLGDVVEVRLRVGAAWNGEPHQVHRRRCLRAVRAAAEHDRADLAGPDAALPVEGHGERLAGVLQGVDVPEQRT